MTKNFRLSEFTVSPTAARLHIDNSIKNPMIEEALLALCSNVLQPARNALKTGIIVTSGYRSEELNETIGGSRRSQHTVGEAADLQCHDNSTLFEIIKDLDFDQLIWEFGTEEQPAWIHVSYKKSGNRNEVLQAIKVENLTKYIRR